MLPPAPNSLTPMQWVGYFACVLSIEGANSASVPLYQPKYLLNDMILEYQFEGWSSLPVTAQVLGRVVSSRAASAASWLTRFVICGPFFSVISLKMPQQMMEG